MPQITGRNGRLNLKNSDVEFGNWNIYARIVGKNEPGQSDCSGSFEIRKQDLGKVFNLLDNQIDADFYGDENYNGKIIIIHVPVSSNEDHRIIDFKGFLAVLYG